MVELIPNPDNYEDIYPESEDDAEESEDLQSESDSESDATKALAEEKKRNDDLMMEADDEKKAAASRLAMLESYGRSFEQNRPSDLKGCISAYSDERKKAFETYKNNEDRIENLKKERVQILKRQARDSKLSMKEKEKASKERLKKLEKKQKLDQEKLTAKRRLKEQRLQFWPRKVYRIILTLDTISELTPASSRRGSTDSLAKPVWESPSGEACQISLSVSYITHSAYWSPRYDLSLDTLTSSGLIIYRAEYCNTTSETWNEAQIILSTSQTVFQGLGEPIPTMLPWHIRLSKRPSRTEDSTSGALMSLYETAHRRRGPMNMSSNTTEPRHALFGLDGVSLAPQQATFMGQHQAIKNMQRQQQAQQQHTQRAQMQLAPQAVPQQTRNTPAGHFGSFTVNPNVANLNGYPPPPNAGNPEGNRALQDYQMQMMLLEQQNQKRVHRARQEQMSSASEDYDKCSDELNAETIVPDLPTLGAPESEWNESGYVHPGKARSHSLSEPELQNHLCENEVLFNACTCFLDTSVKKQC